MGDAALARVAVIDRYALYGEIASGGMASVHLGKLLGPAGFARVVAVKRLHSHYARDPVFVAGFLDEAHVGTRIRHPNVVSILDVVLRDGEVFVVMDYVHGESIARVLKSIADADSTVPVDIATSIVAGALHGLHAAHEALGESGAPLDIVHRDVSPQNILLGADGIARVLDFGIAKARERIRGTTQDELKGKLRYMAPEQLEGQVDRRADIWSTSVVLWEMLAGKHLFAHGEPAREVRAVLQQPIPDLPNVTPDLQEVLTRGLQRSVETRFATAQEMALALERVSPPASPARVAAWLRDWMSESLDARQANLAALEKEESEQARPTFEAVASLVRAGSPPMLAARSPQARATSSAKSTGSESEATNVGYARVASSRASTAARPPSTKPEVTLVSANGRSRSPVVAAAVLTAVVLVAALAVVSIRRFAGEPQAAAEQSAASNIPAASSAPAAETSTPPRPPALASVELPSGGPTPRATTPTGTSVPRPATGPGPRKGPSKTANCNPAYTIGPPPDFLRIPKPECVKP